MFSPTDPQSAVLPAPFVDLFDWLAAAYELPDAVPVVAFLSGLLDGEAFELVPLQHLSADADRLCSAVLSYCLHVGLSEDERLALLARLAPFSGMYEAAIRH
jgi:hypothetical protein